MNFPSLDPGDLDLILLVAVIALWSIVLKILNNRRKVTRHVLHGTVTYTIQGYGGVETRQIAKALRERDPDDTNPEIVPGVVIEK